MVGMVNMPGFNKHAGTAPEIIPAAGGMAWWMERSTRLLTEIPAGLDETTRIRYLVPSGVLAGIVQAIEPDMVPGSVPITVGEVKLPDRSDNWAVKIFPGLHAP